MTLYVIAGHISAPLRPISEDDIPLSFLANIQSIPFIWLPLNHGPTAMPYTWVGSQCLRTKQLIVPFTEAYASIENEDGSTTEINIQTTKKIIVFWLKPQYIKNPGACEKRKTEDLEDEKKGLVSYSEGEAILVPVELLNRRLNLLTFISSAASALNIALYNDERIIYDSIEPQWPNIVGPNFIYFLIGEDTRIPWGGERRFPACYMSSEEPGTTVHFEKLAPEIAYGTPKREIDEIGLEIYKQLLTLYPTFWETSGSWGSSLRK